MPGAGYTGLKAFAFTVGVAITIFIILYVGKRYNPSLFGQQAFPRNRDLNNSLGTRSDGGRPLLGEEPSIWDIRIASWYPFCRQRESRSERLGLGESEDEKPSASGAPNEERGLGWGEFLVSCIYSINPFRPQCRVLMLGP
jgi:hypothetical protein